ncbi:hypothetical protein [Hymenobacter frigidus]|uniref:hypothetical protein n=1 Tax=Hymenobacter frigidus TaxID=1524095 RepID=UPI001E2F7BC3|nr:hypothetical protein [Hymenobacter frigidus]
MFPFGIAKMAGLFGNAKHVTELIPESPVNWGLFLQQQIHFQTRKFLIFFCQSIANNVLNGPAT